MNEIKQRLRTSRNWLSLIEDLEAEAEQLEDRYEKARRLYALGQACEEIFLRKDKAMVNYQKAFKVYPEDVRPLVRARQIYREMGNLKMVAKLMEFQLKVVEKPDDRAALLIEVANVYLDLRRPDVARTRLVEAQALSPSQPGLAEALETANYERSQWPDFVNLLLDAASSARDGEEAAKFLVRAARIYNLEAPEEATREEILRRALEFDPQNDEANFLLETLLAEQSRTTDIVALHEKRAAMAPQEQRAALYRNFASAWAIRFLDVSTTAKFYDRALQSYYNNGSDPFPGHLAAFTFLRGELKTSRDDLRHLLELADEGLNKAPLLEDDQLVLATQAAEIAWREMDDPERAALYFDWVRRLDQDSPALREFATAHGALLEAVEAAQAQAERAAPPPQAAPERETAVIARQEMESRAVQADAEAVATEQVLFGDGGEAAPAPAPEGRRRGRRRRTGEQPVPQAAAPTEEEVVVISEPPPVEAAPVEATPAPAPVEELAPQPQATALASFDEPMDDATAQLCADAARAEHESVEKGIEAWRKVALKAKTLRTPRRALAALYRQVERWNALVEVLKEDAELAADPVEKRDLLRELAALYRDRLHLDAMVVNILGQLSKSNPHDVEVLDDLALQYEKMSRWTDLITVLRHKAEEVESIDEKVELWARVAHLFVERFSNQAEAIKAYEHVLELHPTHREAIEQLKGMYERRRDWDRLIAISQREIDLLDDDTERAVRYLEVAEMATSKLKKPQVSTELWCKVLEYDSSNIEALSQLEQLYERAKEWDNLADVCNRQVDLIADPAKKSLVLQKLGVLFTEKVQDDARAIDAWRRLLELEPENRRAQDALKKLYLQAKNYDELESFYAAHDKWDEFIRVLERQVETEDAETRLRLNFKIANLWLEKLEKPDRAIRAYEKVLSLDESNLAAAEALIPLYEAGRDMKKYAQVLEIQLAHTEDEGTRLERIRHLAELCEEKLRLKDAAFSWYLRAFDVDCRSEWIREQAERLAGEVHRWPELVEAYERAYARLADPLDLLPVMLTVARVYEEQLADTERALSTSQRILELEPQNAQAVGALERLYTKTQQWPELLGIYERKIELVEDPDERKEIYFRIAYLYEEELKDAERAIAAYRTVLDLAGDDIRALRSLTNIYQEQGRWSDLAETLLRELSLLPVDDVAGTIALKYNLGQLRETRLADVDGAIECYRDILELDPTHAGARAALEHKLEDEQHQLAAAQILEPIYQQIGEWHHLVQVHEIQLAREQDPQAKVDLLLRIGALWVEKIGDGERAFEAYSRCFKLEATNELARSELERLASIQDYWEPLAGLYEAATREALDAPLQHELLLKLAAMMDERLEQPERAVEFYRRAQELEPDDLGTLEALEKLYTRAEKWPELLEVYRRRAELSTDPDHRRQLYVRMAYIWEEMLGNLPEAVSCYSEVLAQDDSNLDALRALDRLYQVQGTWHELADNLSRQLALAEDRQETIDLLVRLASLRETELGETAAAVDTYRQVLERDGTNQRAVAALERLIQNEEHQLTVAQILEPYYKTADDWNKLVGIYEIMVAHAFDPTRKIELLHQIGELYEIAGEDAGGAFQVYGRALREDPSHEETQGRLERLARQLEGWEQLVGLYNALVADVTDEMLAVSLHMKVAEIYEEHLGDLAQAAEAYKRILAVDPQNLAAVEALEQIYLRAEAHEQLVEVLLRKAEIVMAADERKALFFRAAQIYEDVLEDLDAAIRVYQMVFDIDDADTTTIEALERLYFRLQRWDNLKDIYARRAELAQDPDDKKQIFYRLGSVYEEQLTDLERAIETFQSVLDLDPEDLTAIRSLDRLYQQAGRWYDLLQVLERQVELAGRSHEGVDLKFRVGQLWERELGDLTRAVETYREVLHLLPTHDPTLAALDAIAHGKDEPVLAAQVLEPVYEQSLEWEKLIDLYEVMVRHVEDPFRKLELLHRIAELYELRVEDSRRAFEAYGRALTEDSTDEQALMNLERLADEIKGWEDLAKLYEVELEKLIDPMRQVEMGLRVARVYEEELKRAPEAIRHYKRVLEVDVENRAAILALDRLYGDGEQWAELAEILRREIRMADTDDQVIDLQFRLGALYQERLGDLTSSIECYREILTVAPTHSPAVTSLELLFEEGQQQLEIAEILEPLYRMSEQWEKLVKIMTVQLERMESADDKVQAVQRIAEICEQRLGDHLRAFRWWGHAFAVDPRSDVVSEELERLARIVDGWEELVGFYNGVLAKLDPEDRRRVLKMMARVHDDEINDRARAEESYLYVLQIDPQDADALAALDRIYEQTGMFQELAEILKRRIAVTDSSDLLVQLQLRLGGTYELALEDLDSAVATYRAVLDTDSRNAQALAALEKTYFKREQWAELYDVYERMVDVAPGDSGVAECYARMAKIASDALADSERAQDLWNRVLDLRGEDPVALWALADLYEAAGEWRELVEVLQRQVHIVEEPEPQVRLYQRLGRIWGEKLGRDRNALESWQKVLEIDRSNIAALYAIAEIYRNTQAWQELVETLHRLIEIGITGDMSEQDLHKLYTQLGELEGEILMRPQEAIEAWRKVLDLQPDDFRALGALEQLLTQEARWEECIQVLQRKVEVLQGPQDKIDVLMQAASIWQERVGDNASAGRVYEQVLSLDAANRVAFVALEQIYREGWHWEKLIDLLLARVDHSESVSETVELLQGTAKVYEEQLDAPEQAFVVLQAAFKQDYTNDITAQELERLASTTNKWNELLTEYHTVVQAIVDPKVKSNLLVKMGRWYGSELGHLDYAIASVQQALQIDPENVPALETLAGFYRKTARWSELVQVVNRAAQLEGDPEKKVGLYLQMAELFEMQLGDQGQAINAYRRALDVDGTNNEALDALERLYRMYQQWEQLIAILARKAELAQDPEAVIELKGSIGELYEERVGDHQASIECYKDILNLEPQNLPALKALEGLYEKTGQTEAYLDVLEQQLDVTGSDEARMSLYQRMAVVWEEQFTKLDRAAECLEKILLIDDRNLATYRSLERLYRQDTRFEDLVDVLRRHVNATGDPHERIELYMKMGEVYEGPLQDKDRAIEAYTDILTFDPDHTQALDALARLYEEISDWSRAVDVMIRLVQLVDDAAYRVNVLYRLGRIYEEHLRDAATAEERYQQALEIDSTHEESMKALVEIYKQRGDWAKAAQMMIRAEAHSSNPLEKSRLLYEAGMAYLTQMDDEATAGELFARTLQVDPDHVAAGDPLSRIFFRDGRYQDLEPVLDMLVRKADRRDNKTLQDLYYRLGKTADALGKNEKALKYYRAAYDIDSTHLPTLIGMADLLYRMQDWDRAFKIYQTILVHHRDSQRKEEIVDIFYRLGDIKLKLGERKKALNMFEKALEVEPAHRQTLLAIIDLQAKQNDWEAVVAAKRALLPALNDQERYQVHMELGELYRTKLNNAQKAIGAYQEALEILSENHAALHEILELYTETKQWKKAVEIVLKLISIEPSAATRGKYYYSVAVIYRDEVKALDDAIEYFNKVLDEDTSQLKAFEAIDRICTQKKDWKTQERSYRKMLKRLPQDGQNELKTMLWHALGEIYRTRLKDFKSAIASFEVAASMEPENTQRHEILAELYMLSGPEYADKAIAEQQTLIKRSPFKIEAYKALRRIYMDIKHYDKAWCLCSTLAFLKKADPEEQQFFEQYRQRGFVRAKARMTDEIWQRYAFHPDEDRYIGAIFATIAPVVASMSAKPHKAFQLKRKDKRDLATDQLLFSKVFNYVTSVLNVVQAELYLQPERPAGLQMAHTQEAPSFVVGADLLQGRPEKELAFAIAKQLTYLRPEHFLRNVLPAPSQLRTVFLSALKMCNPQFQLPPAEELEVDKIIKFIRTRMHPGQLEQVALLVRKFVASKAEVDLARWLTAVELSANRVGFLLCNDLEVAAKMVSTEPTAIGGLPPKEKVKELVLYSVSEEYFAVRAQLGLGIGQ
ncbi:MAG: tetratricopeptide repeat protein [Deltaproteobacteria bacterium]|nr:tetratricopeptide repeat protein [Deltaproteobacteria bacterium]